MNATPLGMRGEAAPVRRRGAACRPGRDRHRVRARRRRPCSPRRGPGAPVPSTGWGCSCTRRPGRSPCSPAATRRSTRCGPRLGHRVNVALVVGLRRRGRGDRTVAPRRGDPEPRRDRRRRRAPPGAGRRAAPPVGSGDDRRHRRAVRGRSRRRIGWSWVLPAVPRSRRGARLAHRHRPARPAAAPTAHHRGRERHPGPLRGRRRARTAPATRSSAPGSAPRAPTWCSSRCGS